MTSVDGLITGLDTKTIISQLMQIERLPQTLLSQRRTKEEAVASSLGTVRTSVLAVRDLARQLRTPDTFQPLKATSSSDAVTVTAGAGRTSGSLQVRVARTAGAAALFSEAVPSLDSVIAPGGSVFSHPPARGIGFDSIKGNGIPIGDLPIVVEVPTKGASTTGSALQGFPVTVAAGGGELTVEVDGTSHTVSLAGGTYATARELEAGLSAAITAEPALAGALRTSLDGNGALTLTTTREGSAATLAITGGSALATLGLSAGGPVTGVDGAVRVGTGGPLTAIPDTAAGASHTLAADQGSLSVTMSGPLRTGTVTGRQVSLGRGTLGEVVQAINGAGGLGYTATAVNVGSGYRLQLTAKQTGAASTVDIDQQMFSGLSQPFSVLSQGRDAELVVVGDAGAEYRVTSSTNTFTDLLPGVDVTARTVTTDPVTISTEPDHPSVAAKVAELVEKVNAALKAIAGETAFDPATGRGSPLTGNSAVRRATQDLTRALVDPVPGSAVSTAGQLGITLGRDGTFTFDQAAFTTRLAEDPAAVGALFSEFAGGTTPGVLDRLSAVANDAVAFGTGYLTSARDATQKRIESYTGQIEAYETRMVLRENQLRRTYANLETSLSGLQNQGTWLAGQLGGLSSLNQKPA